MARVKNVSDQPLTMPVVGTVVRPGATVRVEKWDVVSKADTVRSWLRSNFLEVLDEQILTTSDDNWQKPEIDLELTEVHAIGGEAGVIGLQSLRDQAKDLGISVHHRWSDDRIQEEIDKKLAE